MILVVLSVIFLSAVTVTYAITDEFSVQTLIGSDTNPPSAPSPLTATPVATTQINLSWGTSTDDFLLSGYHVYRDDVRIATSTATTYSDIGLTASTSYSYYVTAFDASFNISASSSLVSTTTLSPAPTGTPTETESILGRIFGSKRDPFKDQIESIRIISSSEGAILEVTTRDPMRLSVRYGPTPSYELGIIGAEYFSRTHMVHISELTPHTKYYISLEGELGDGRKGALYTTSFTTQEGSGSETITNVLNLRGEAVDQSVQLSWEYPPMNNFSHVRVVRNDRFYPQDHLDGAVVYEGGASTYLDQDAFRDTKVQYYTVFTYTRDGHVSSGAIVRVRVPGIVEEEEVHTNTLNVSFDDVFLIQDGRQVQREDGRYILDGTRELTVSIPYHVVPEHLKSIIGTVTNQDGESFAFLLRRGEGQESYQATIAPFGRGGTFTIAISIFDYEQGEVGYSEEVVYMEIPPSYVAEPYEDVITGLIQFFARDGFWFLILTLLCIYILIMLRRLLVARWS